MSGTNKEVFIFALERKDVACLDPLLNELKRLSSNVFFIPSPSSRDLFNTFDRNVLHRFCGADFPIAVISSSEMRKIISLFRQDGTYQVVNIEHGVAPFKSYTYGPHLVASDHYIAPTKLWAERLQRLYPDQAHKVRVGLNWEAVEDWGCWVRGGTGELRVRLPEVADAFQIYLHLAVPTSDTPLHEITISVPEAKWTLRTQIENGSNVWRSFSVQVPQTGDRTITLRLSGSPVVDFQLRSNGQDSRTSGLAVLGIYFARADSEAERLALVEAIQFKDLNGLARRFVTTATIGA